MSVADSESVVAIAAEEQARANVYALLSRLFSAPAGAQLLDTIACSDPAEGDAAQGHGSDGGFARAWRQLVTAAGETDATAQSDEYHLLFIGSGRADVSLYAGAYTARSSVDTPLVALRSFLAGRGLQRQRGVHEPEDHVAMLFEVMRYLISEERSALAEQRVFFERFIWPGGIPLCDAITGHAQARFFRSVAVFTKSFLLVEHDAFDM